MKIDNKKSQKFIVGIGASAGVLEALQKLLSALPANTGFPYIIVQHLSPDYKSLLSQNLSKYTEMPVVQRAPALAFCICEPEKGCGMQQKSSIKKQDMLLYFAFLGL